MVYLESSGAVKTLPISQLQPLHGRHSHTWWCFSDLMAAAKQTAVLLYLPSSSNTCTHN